MYNRPFKDGQNDENNRRCRLTHDRGTGTTAAQLYHIRRCLHDYSDDVRVGILKTIRGAMRADSRLVIVEKVIDNPRSATRSTRRMIYTWRR